MAHQHRKVLDPDGENRYQKAVELCAGDVTKIDEVVREILGGKHGFHRVTGPRWGYLYNVITHRLRGTILAKQRKDKLAKMFGEETARRMRREAALNNLNLPASSR